MFYESRRKPLAAENSRRWDRRIPIVDVGASPLVEVAATGTLVRIAAAAMRGAADEG
jgi:hypothetical protein